MSGLRGSDRPPPHRRWLSAHGRACFDALGRLWRQPLASLLSTAVLGVTLALPTALHVLVSNLGAVGSDWQHGARITVFVRDGVSEPALRALAAELQSRPDVHQVETLTREQALAEFKAYSGLGEAVAMLPDNPLPATLIVTPAARLDTQEVEALRSALAQHESVEDVLLDMQWLERLSALLTLLEKAVGLFALTLAAAVLVIIGNTIRLDVAARREEIEVMKLIGAPDRFIQRPFLYSGFWHGLIGGLVALVLVGVALLLLQTPVQRLASSYGSDFVLTGPSASAVVAVLLGGCTLGLLGAWGAVLRQLRVVEPA
ncbi:permease-like cell division protein FtsX [Algiphilus sp.]|uniref:permease-like cell division protein FtsX n=1 Tax=Algiphilus sp. TaxID=1872431 RepID=UPI003B52CD39